MTTDSTRPAWPFKAVATLTAHSRGAWCKKINGKMKYFGKWRNPDPDDAFARAALKRYLALAQANVDGVAVVIAPADVTVGLLVNHWLTDREEAVGDGELTSTQFMHYRRLGKEIVEALGGKNTIASIGPDDMKRLRDSFAGNPTTRGSKIRWARGCFNWGLEYYGVRPRYGGMFSAPAKAAVRRAKKLFNPPKPHEILAVLKVATPAVRCFTLLGLNCAFGQMDCATLPVVAVDYETKRIHFPRGKTGIERFCPMWPETVAAMKAYVRPSQAMPELFFITRFGKPYVSIKTHTVKVGEDEQIVRVTRTDSVLKEFVIAQRMAVGGKSRHEVMGDKWEGARGFYVLRHMFRSVAESTGKTNAIRLIMGHAFPGMDEYYLHARVGGYRDLKVVTERVRRWLFGKKKRS